MENINKIDPYEAIISMKWAPETGQIEMNPIPAGTEVSVIQKGVFVTDNQGALLIRNKEDTQIFSNLLNHVWELWIIPVSHTHLRAHETKANLVCRLLLE